MMKATPAPSLVLAQAELLFELPIVPLNAAAHFGGLDQFAQLSGSGMEYAMEYVWMEYGVKSAFSSLLALRLSSESTA